MTTDINALHVPATRLRVNPRAGAVDLAYALVRAITWSGPGSPPAGPALTEHAFSQDEAFTIGAGDRLRVVFTVEGWNATAAISRSSDT